jgi:hypothetical protein
MPCLLQNQLGLLQLQNQLGLLQLQNQLDLLQLGELLLPQMLILGELQSPRVLRLGELLAVQFLNVPLTMFSRLMGLVLFLVDQLPQNVHVRQLNGRLC